MRSKFDALSRAVVSLELQKQKLMKDLQELNDQISNSRERMEHNRIFLQEIDQLYQKKMKLEELVRRLEHDSVTYLGTKSI